METVNHTHVCIVGAGPTGLTLANELRRYEIPFILLERRTERTVDSKAFALHARSLEVFRRMGVVDPLLERGLPVPGMAVWAGNRCVIKGDLTCLESEYPYVLSIPQAETESVLLERLCARGGSVQWGQTLIGTQQTADAVIVNYADQEGNYQELHCRWLVGCDGAHSQVRHLSNIGWEGDDYDFEFLVADGKIDWKGDARSGQTFLNRLGYVMLFPLPGDRHRIVINVDVGRFDRHQLSADLVNRLLEARNLNDVHFHSPFWLSSTQGRRRIARNFKHGRIFLAGDAAHVHSPLGGQGLNTGIQDAYQLAWRLAILKDLPSAEHPLLTGYAQERHQIAQEVLKNTDSLTRLFTTRSPLSVALRNWVLPSLTRRKRFNEKLAATASGVGLSLRKPVQLVRGVVKHGLIGTRLPTVMLTHMASGVLQCAGNVIATEGYELVILLAKRNSSGFYVAKRVLAQLCLTDEERLLRSRLKRCSLVITPSVQNAMIHWPGELAQAHYLDADQKLMNHCGIEDAGYLLVRPDGYIACAGTLGRAEDLLHNLRSCLYLLHENTTKKMSQWDAKIANSKHSWVEV